MWPIFYWPGMSTTIERFIRTCVTCKRAKLHGGKQKHGLLPPRTLQSANPFDVVHVDLIGSYERGKYSITIIDHATRWLKTGIHDNKEDVTTAESFDLEWLCRYPRPLPVVHDLGTEFTGDEFQELLRSYGINPSRLPRRILRQTPFANAYIWKF